MSEERRGIEFEHMSLQELGKTLLDLQAQHDFHAEQKAELHKQLEVIKMSIIPDKMEDEEIDSLTITDVGRLQLKRDAFVSCLAGNRDALHDWLRQNGHEPLIKEAVHAGTLKAFVKAQIKDGKEYPTDLIKYEAYVKASLVKK